jgi:hypothetical protein
LKPLLSSWLFRWLRSYAVKKSEKLSEYLKSQPL